MLLLQLAKWWGSPIFSCFLGCLVYIFVLSFKLDSTKLLPCNETTFSTSEVRRYLVGSCCDVLYEIEMYISSLRLGMLLLRLLVADSRCWRFNPGRHS